MLIIEKRIAPQPRADVDIELRFEERRKARQRLRLASGEEVALFLERGLVLRGGDFLQSEDGRVARVVAACEPLMEVRTDDRGLLVRAAYHLGNRHCAVEVLEAALRFPADHVLAEMLHGLGLAVATVTAPFEPEAGAYAAGHQHHSGEAKHTGIIHDFAARGSRS